MVRSQNTWRQNNTTLVPSRTKSVDNEVTNEEYRLIARVISFVLLVLGLALWLFPATQFLAEALVPAAVGVQLWAPYKDTEKR